MNKVPTFSLRAPIGHAPVPYLSNETNGLGEKVMLGTRRGLRVRTYPATW
jgi:hypothetical protein